MATRKAIAKKFYFNSDEAETNSAQDDSVGFGFHFFDPTGAKDKEDKPIVVETIKHLASEFPEVVQNKAMLMGFLQKIGDDYAGKGDEAIDIAHTMVERLMENDWVIGGKGGVGPQPSMLLDAIMSVLVESGVADTDEKRADVKAAIATKEQKDAALNNPKVKAAYEGLKAAKAAERAAKAAKAAKEAGGEADDTFLKSFA